MANKCSVIRNDKNEIEQVLASNGKPSRLYEDITSIVKNKEEALRLWAQTHTPQFEKWFGDSKMVDTNKEPLLLFYKGQGNMPIFSRTEDASIDEVKSLFNNGSFSSSSHNIYQQRNDSGGVFSDFGKLQTLLQKLYNRFNIPYKLVNEPGGDKGRFGTDGVVYINTATASGDTAFHEYLHPFILALEKQNPVLYKNLIDELSTTENGIKAFSETERKYPELNQKNMAQEALVSYLGKLAEANYNKPMSAFNRFVKWLKSLFKKINIDFGNLSLNSKMSDVADLITDDVFVADLRKELEDAEVLVRYQKADTALTYEEVYDRIKDRVLILKKTIAKRKKGDQFKQDIEELNEVINNSDEITSINNFVSSSITYMDAAFKRFESLRNSVKNVDKLSKGEISYNLHILSELQQLLNVYQSLNDIKLLYVREGMKSTDDVMAKLRDAIDQKDLMIEDFKSFALTYLTEWLYPYIDSTNKLLEAKGKINLLLSKDDFRDQLVMALRDISAAGYWLGTTINSRDPVSAAVGLALKDVIYDNHVTDNEIKEHLTNEYEKVRGTALYKSAKDEEQFNLKFLREAEVWEKIGEDEDGTPKFGYVKRLAFHEEYLFDQFAKARRELYDRIGPKPVGNPNFLKAWKKAQAEWYANNTQVHPDALKIVAEKRQTLTKRQYEDWELSNTKEVEDVEYGYGRKLSDYYGQRVISHNPMKGTFKVMIGSLILPANKYRNTQFGIINQNAYYKKLYTTYKEANEKLSHFGLNYGIIPQVSKGKNLFSELEWKNGVKENLKQIGRNIGDSVKADFDPSRTAQRQDGTELKHIPVKYTKMLKSEDLVTDLLQSTLKYSQMANNYSAMAEIEPNIIVLKTILNGDLNLGIKGRDIAKTNAKGIQMLNSVTKKVVPKMAREDMLNNRLNEFINDVVYGDEEFEQSFNLFGKEISINKLSGRVALFTALQNMAVNVTGGINNVVVGNFNNTVEAIGGRFWEKKDWAWANKEYFANFPQFVGEIAGVAESDINKMADHYDVPQGEFKDHYGNNVSKGQVNKLMKTSSLFFLQKGGEHQIQLTAMMALMRRTKLKRVGSDEEVNLYDAWKEAKGDVTNTHKFNWTINDDTAFRNRLHAIVKNLHGVYNSFDKSVLQRRWYGKLAIMFRKYLFKAFQSRYGAEYVDYELGDEDGGYWRAFANKLLADTKEYKWAMFQKMWTKEGYTEFQKSAFNKTLYELGAIIATFALIGVASAPPDDGKKKGWLDNETALQLTRFSADITQYISPSDFIRVIRNPAASVNMMEKWIDWFTQLFSPGEEYKRASGIAKAGDNKLYIKTLKLLPVVRQMVNLLTPDEQLKFYKLTGR